MHLLSLMEQLIHDRTGLKIQASRRDQIEGVMTSIAQELQTDIPRALDMLAMLESDDDLWQRIVAHLTVGETYFFRNRYHMHALRYSVLPEIIQKRRAADFKYINIWSAGCATGEEPYTIAILLRELLPDIEEWTITILATDINRRSLDVARRAHYRKNSFRSETPPQIQSRYFNSQDGHYVLDKTIRQMVTFNSLNLITGDYPSFATRTMHQDIILCRNVTIYFDAQTTQRVLQQFHASLGQGGWLVVGHSEPMVAAYQNFQPRNFENAIFYQKLALQPVSPPLTSSQPVTLPKTSSLTSTAPAISFEDVRDAMDQADWITARSLLDDIARHDPMNATMHYLRGVIAMNTDDLDQAYEAMRRALYCDPKCLVAHYAIGEIYHQQSKTELATSHWVKAYQLAQTLDPDIPLAGDAELTIGLFRELVTSRLTQQRTIS